MKGRRYLSLLAVPAFLYAAAATAQIQLGILDDFEAGPMMCGEDNWIEGGGSPNPPVGELLCGELETCCLSAPSAGGFGPGSRQVIFNETQWTGDYIAAGVNVVQMQAANASATETINLRIGITNALSCFVSTDPIVLAPATPGPDGLVFARFILDESTMTEVSGNLCKAPGLSSFDEVMSDVIQLRIISSASPAWAGDAIESELQLEAIQSRADSDLDGVNNDLDNCTDRPNPDQIDSNGDGFGNACDADLDNDCQISFSDLGILKSVFFTDDADADLTGDGQVNFADLGVMKGDFFGAPGPGLGACGDCVAPDALGANADFAGLPMFMRGGLVNDWGADPNINGFSDQTGGLYVARFEVNSGSFEWKIADEGWSIEYCTDTNLVENTATNAPLFGCAFPANGTIDVPATGCYEFQMQTDGNIPPAAVDVTFTPVN
ncbi:MAG: hypothetical protein AAFN78_12260 [Pseudomonadota bacterium]